MEYRESQLVKGFAYYKGIDCHYEVTNAFLFKPKKRRKERRKKMYD